MITENCERSDAREFGDGFTEGDDNINDERFGITVGNKEV